MTDRQKVYTEVVRTLKDLLKGQKQGHVVTLAMMITGIVMSKKAQLSVMSSEVPHWAKTASVEKRMHRFVKNQGIDAQVHYMPFAEALIAALAKQTFLTCEITAHIGPFESHRLHVFLHVLHMRGAILNQHLSLSHITPQATGRLIRTKGGF